MNPSSSPSPQSWLGLSIGNTHWKWAYFQDQQMVRFWKTKAIPQSQMERISSWEHYCENFPSFNFHQETRAATFPPLRLSSVVPSATQLWQNYPNLYQCHINDLPLGNLYASLGIDRGLALLGAGIQYGWPALVVDAGTALTFSGADADARFQGGAIAPGLGLQLTSLHQNTGALPLAKTLNQPQRWAMDTQNAILSGVCNGLSANVTDFCRLWRLEHPDSAIVFTGGDGQKILDWCRTSSSNSLRHLFENDSYFDPHLIFYGMGYLHHHN